MKQLGCSTISSLYYTVQVALVRNVNIFGDLFCYYWLDVYLEQCI